MFAWLPASVSRDCGHRMRECVGDSGLVYVRHVEQALTTPDSNDTHVLRVTPVNDAKRWPDQLT